MNKEQIEQKAKEYAKDNTYEFKGEIPLDYSTALEIRSESFTAGAEWRDGEADRLREEVERLKGEREADRLKRQELKLALHMLLKVFKATDKTTGQQKFYDAAEKVLTKNFEVSDILRSEPPKPQSK